MIRTGKSEAPRIAVGSDHAGFALKQALAGELAVLGYDVVDVGTDSEESCDYPDFALEVAEMVASGSCHRGVLVCGTGAGMAICANKVPGVRAAVCNDEYTARFSRLHNDANVIALGSRIIDARTAQELVKIFLETGYEGDHPGGERHRMRLVKLEEIEREYMKRED